MGGCVGSDLNETMKSAGEAVSKTADDVKKGADEAKKTVDDAQKEVKKTEAEAKKAVADAEKEVKKVETDAKKAVADAEKEVKKAETDAKKTVDSVTKAADDAKKQVGDAAKTVAAVFTPVKVYGLAASTCTRRVLMTLEEKKVPYELVVIDLMTGEHKKPEFLAIQPFGQIPVLVDGDITIFESRSIARYVATKWASQGTELLGKDVAQQALTDNWLEVESNNFNPPISTIVAEKVFKLWRGETTDEAVVAAKVEELNKVLDIYEQHLSKSAYLTGAEFSLADLSHLSYTHYLIHAAKVTEPLDKHPAVKAWWDKISSRPAWVKLTAQ